MDHLFHIADLIVKQTTGEISEVERKELQQWLKEDDENLALYERITDTGNQLSKLEVYRLFDKERAWDSLNKEINQSRRIHFSSRQFLRYAASIVLPIAVTIYLVFHFSEKTTQVSLAKIDSVIKPGSQKAVLILSDGGSIELDSTSGKNELSQGISSISNANNNLVYSTPDKEVEPQPLIYNELRTPRGGGYRLTLADGTNVWLSAESSLRYPVAFTDSTRQVYLSGQAYFDVSHNGKPFLVSSENMNIRVLGTAFNVSAYKDDIDIKTTLVEGKIKIGLVNLDGAVVSSSVLTPDDQALIQKGETEIEVNKVITSQYTSWIEGKIEFNNENLDMVMKRLARWYDFEYSFDNEKSKNYHFTARINGEESISSILEMLEMTTDVKFELKDNMIVVL